MSPEEPCSLCRTVVGSCTTLFSGRTGALPGYPTFASLEIASRIWHCKAPPNRWKKRRFFVFRKLSQQLEFRAMFLFPF